MAAAAAVTMIIAGLGGTASSGASSASKTITIGVLADITGAGSNTAGSFPTGIKAGIGVADKEGYHIKYVVADTATSPGGALTAAQTLVEQDHVSVVMLTSVVGFGAAPYLATQGVPVIGCACDGTEWITDRNMFSVIGTQNYNDVQTTYGLFLKAHGVTNVATVGYSVEPSSEDAAKDVAVSAEQEGIKVGYINTNFPLGSTNVTPIALAMKSAGINGLSTAILTNSTFALITALKQEGVDLKAALPPTGYGGDLTEGGKDAETEAQGVYFLSGYEPVEMHTAATEALQSAMKTYAGVSGDPTFAEYIGYASVLALVEGLKADGNSTNPTSLINALVGIKSFNAGGLYGSHSISWAMDQRGKYMSADDCVYITLYKGTAFHLVSGEDPLCGKNVTGKTIADAPSS
jgi:branched-chain amino acid transport system substrate-binding protein